MRNPPISRTPAKRAARALAGVVLCAMTVGLAGCKGGMPSIFNSFFDPSQVGSYGPFGREGTLDIRSSLTLQDAPTGVMGVSDPQPEDLLPVVEDYKYRIGDALNVRLYELLQAGTETAVQATIDETGNIVVPVLGRIEVTGLTLPEIHAELVNQLTSRGLLIEPEVIVEPVVRRGLSYTIYGTIAQPNLYPLAQYDLRLLDAINVAGGLLDQVTEIYVVRAQRPPEPVFVSGSVAPEPWARRSARGESKLSDGHAAGTPRGLVASATAVPPESAGPARESARREVLDLTDQEPTSTRAGVTPGTTTATPSVPQWIYRNGEWIEVQPEQPTAERSSLPAPESAPTTKEARKELIETMIGEPAPSVPMPAAPAEPVPATPSQPRWIYYNGKWIETEAPTSTPAEAAASKPIQIPERATQPAIDWGQVAGLGEHRVIKVLATGLREGDPRQNVIIRPGDAIRLAAGGFGEYYVMGQVIRPGAYSLTGRTITLKSVVAAAGNLSPLAWPQYCTVYRRLGDREQMIQVDLDAIFSGKEQDFFIKQDDLILVGTHPVAPFLAVLRNAFRVSYGFGFVYDRNFADIDSYGGKPNPVYQQRRFPNLFQ
ncbi:MAG: polysaccharide biosynthesis/export family protein [Planctomycetota bacterium]